VQALLGKNLGQYLYFAASIFWRASARSWKIGTQQVSRKPLGPYQEAFRLYLLHQEPFPDNARIRVHVSSEPQPDMSIVFPTTSQADGVHMHKFYIPGLLFILFLGRMVPQRRELDVGSLNGTPPNLMWICPWREDGLFHGFVDLIKGSKPSKKLRR
jgi:hypothetical protein